MPVTRTVTCTFRSTPGSSPPAAWRGLHTVGFRDSIEAINGIGHAAVMCDPEFRPALAAAGFTLDPATGEVAELAPYVGAFSERAAQIGRNIDRYEAEWRAANPGQEPGPGVRRSWDRRAWKDARPDKVVPTDGAELVDHWNQQLHDLGYRDPHTLGLPIVVGDTAGGGSTATPPWRRSCPAGREAVGVERRRHPRRGREAIAAAGLVADPAVRIELAEDLTARPSRRACRCWTSTGVPEHVRSLTSRDVLDVEADIVAGSRPRRRPVAAGDAAEPVDGRGAR